MRFHGCVQIADFVFAMPHIVPSCELSLPGEPAADEAHESFLSWVVFRMLHVAQLLFGTEIANGLDCVISSSGRAARHVQEKLMS